MRQMQRKGSERRSKGRKKEREVWEVVTTREDKERWKRTEVEGKKM